MSTDEQIHYHQGRAMRELDQGFTAKCTAAARAHLQLSSLHMARVRDLQGSSVATRPTMIID
jgi:hypothetical protein